LLQDLNQQNLLFALVSSESLGLNWDFQKPLVGLGLDLTWYSEFSSLELDSRLVFWNFLRMLQIRKKIWNVPNGVANDVIIQVVPFDS